MPQALTRIDGPGRLRIQDPVGDAALANPRADPLATQAPRLAERHRGTHNFLVDAEHRARNEMLAARDRRARADPFANVGTEARNGAVDP